MSWHATTTPQPWQVHEVYQRLRRSPCPATNESQDSQLVLDAYMRAYGIGIASSSPAPEELDMIQDVYPEPNTYFKSPYTRNRATQHAIKPREAFTETRNATLLDVTTPPSEVVLSTSACINEVFEAGEASRRREVQILTPHSTDGQAGACPVVHKNSLVDDDTPGNPLGTAAQKMDSSQSPTQSNDGRSYEQYFPQSSPQDRTALMGYEAEHPTPHTQSTQHDQRSLAENDTGAVVFDFNDAATTYPEHNSLMSELPEPSPVVDVGSHGRRRTFAQALAEQAAASQTKDAPETPVVSHNPFGANNRAQLVPTSQLFKATQFSSAFRGASPTSSRPSPNDFPHDSISPNPISSPLKARGLRSSPTTGGLSSPQLFEAADDLATPLPRHRPKKPSRLAPDPKGIYVPMRQSQEKRSSHIARSDSGGAGLSDDDDEDDPIDRRRRVQSKKKASLERLTSIQFTRTPRTEKIEVPKTSTKKEKKSRPPTGKALGRRRSKYLSQDDVQVDEVVEDSQNARAKSQEPIVIGDNDLTQSTQGETMGPPEGTVMRSSTTSVPPHSGHGRRRPALRTKSTDSSLTKKEMIPETSPVAKQPSQPFPDPGGTPVATQSTLGPMPSFRHAVVAASEVEKEAPNIPASSATEFVPAVVETMETPAGSVRPPSPSFSSPSREPEVTEQQGRSSPVLPSLLPQLVAPNRPALPSSPPAPAFSTRSKKRQFDAFAEPRAPTVSPITEPPLTTERIQPKDGSVSSLSSLNSTPTISQTATNAPVPAESLPAGARRREDAESPVVAKNKRRRGADGLPRLPALGTTESLRSSTRLSRRQYSDSIDELAWSPSSTPTFEQSLRLPARTSTARLSRTSTRDLQSAREPSTGVQRPPKLFAGMAFAISFQAKKSGENAEQQEERMESAKILETRIIQAGGKLLSGGFDELFEVSRPKSVSASPASSASSQHPEDEVKLKASARHLGFTCLIADGHSRKVKYMQALALGLPCLAPRWITTCLDRNEIVDWTPYLLCAGQSAFLGGAYRSRSLAPYEATTARLSDIVDSRAQLLKDEWVLLVMKKADNVRKGPYVFLARILGASLCQVHSLEEARSRLKQMEALKEPFDWVYVDDKFDKDELFDPGASKRRKSRGVTHPAPAAEGSSKPPSKIRTLSDELVIQSLILGRLIGDGEMEE